MMPSPASYNVGWICALLVEYVAAQEFLDEEHELNFVAPNDSNNYTLGRIKEHNVVITVLPDGEYGTASANNVATNMINTFHNLKIGLLVGVGGGVPSRCHDIRLGDVVVGTPRGLESGVFQYDFGKSIQGRTFKQTRFLNQPPIALRTAITGIQAQYKRKGHRLKESIDKLLDENPRLRGEYEQPPLSTDRLFKAEIAHNSGDCAITCASDSDNLVPRDERPGFEDCPKIHYGLIASGNQLMKDALIRDKLGAEKEILCFEMEAAGIMNTLPCLVIRGICDYSDSHKNKGWQGFAAMTAAAYAKDLLDKLPKSQIDAEERISSVISDELKGANKRLDHAFDQKARQYSEQKAKALTDQQKRCLLAFKVVNYEAQKNINPPKAEGTCQWALQSTEYTRWLESCYNNLLWVSADPGCGKSVLARSIIDGFQKAVPREIIICYFFFKENDEQNNLAIALCSILHQLFSQVPSLLSYATLSFEKNGDKIQDEIDELWRILIAATSSRTTKIICVFDGLDECYKIHQTELIRKLGDFHQQPFPSTQNTYLKFLVTSRPYSHIHTQFKVITDNFPYLRLKGEEENDQIRKEIDLVVKMAVKNLAEAAAISLETQQRLEDSLLRMQNRTYLWLHLAINDIRSTLEISLRPSEESIRIIPPSVDEAYDKILSRVPLEQENTVKKVFQIIIASRRPLSTSEMGMALGIATCPQAQTTAEASIHSSHIEQKLRNLCGLFVFINESRIYLIHQTARDFLIRESASTKPNFRYTLRMKDCEHQIVYVSLRYLLMRDNIQNEAGATGPQSFLQYSATMWPEHVRAMGKTSDPQIFDLLSRIYEMNDDQLSLWLPIFWKRMMPTERIPKMKALHLAAFNGHEQVIRYLIARDNDSVNSLDNTLTLPITWAAVNGYERAVEILLEHGADPNTNGGRRGNSLYAACSNGHESVVQVLLKRGIDLDSQTGDCGTALHTSCLKGHQNIVEMLVNHNADVNIKDAYFGTPLQIACHKGYVKIIKMLLHQKVDVNARGGVYGTALYCACSSGRLDIVQLLLDNGAQVNAPSGTDGTSLNAAYSFGHFRVAQLLLEHGADVNMCGRFEYINIHDSPERGKMREMLREAGAEFSVRSHFGPFDWFLNSPFSDDPWTDGSTEGERKWRPRRDFPDPHIP